MASPPVAPPLAASVVARVFVPDAEADVLFLVVQYLRDLGLSTSVVALLRESGVDPFWLCGPSREVALLREWVFQGEWQRVVSLLTPLRSVLGDEGYAHAMAIVKRQQLVEEYFLNTTSAGRRREILDELQSPARHEALRLTRQELGHCMRRLKGDGGRQHSWSLDEARLSCFESLVPLLRDDIGDDDDESKYLTMPRRQLVALLNDARQLHNRDVHGGDFISLAPLSQPSLSTERGGDALASSLRLAEAARDAKPASSSTSLAQSVDLSQWHRPIEHTAPASVKRATQMDYESKRGRQNPLAMSIDFTRAAAPRSKDRSRSTHHENAEASTTEDDGNSEDDVAEALPRSQVTRVEACTQTEGLGEEQALRRPPVESDESETFATVLKQSNASQASAHCNQTVDTSEDLYVLDRSRTKEATAVSVDQPLEAWCTARRGSDVNAGEQTGGAPTRQRTVLSGSRSMRSDPMSRSDGGEAGQSPIEPESVSGENEDDEDEHEEQDPVDGAIEEGPNERHGLTAHGQTLSPRSYAELTVDSIVRARVIAEVREAQAIRAMDIAPDGSEMVIGTNARALRVFDLMEPLATAASAATAGLHSFLPLLPVCLERHKHHASSIYAAAYNHVSPAHATPLIATGAAESSIKVLSRWTQQEIWIQGHSGKCRALQFASPSLLCSAASGDLVIRAWDLNSTKGNHCLQRFDGHVGEIQAMAITGLDESGLLDHRCFVSSSMDRTVRLWDLRSVQCARVVARTSSPAFALAFRPQGGAATVLATGHQDGSVSLWDLRSASRSAKPLATIPHHHEECRAVSWSPDGHWLLSASFDGTLCLLGASTTSDDLCAMASFHQHEDKILQAQWHPTQPAIVTTGADKLVKLWGFA